MGKGCVRFLSSIVFITTFYLANVIIIISIQEVISLCKRVVLSELRNDCYIAEALKINETDVLLRFWSWALSKWLFEMFGIFTEDNGFQSAGFDNAYIQTARMISTIIEKRLEKEMIGHLRNKAARVRIINDDLFLFVRK